MNMWTSTSFKTVGELQQFLNTMNFPADMPVTIDPTVVTEIEMLGAFDTTGREIGCILSCETRCDDVHRMYLSLDIDEFCEE